MPPLRLLAVVTGDYGRRHVKNIREHGPPNWAIEVWEAPTALPIVIDYPEDWVPETLPAADILLAFHEHKGVAELIPEAAGLSGARSVLAPIDNEAWLPRGLARQLQGWLAKDGIACATPKPLCSLTETRYLIARGEWVPYDDNLIAEFARHFGKPELDLTVDPHTRTIVAAQVNRDAVCGCARFVAAGLIGVSADDAEQEGGLLHHHFPCLASMGIDPAFGDTLMHVSGNLLRDDIGDQVKPFKRIRYIAPGEQSE